MTNFGVEYSYEQIGVIELNIYTNFAYRYF